MSKPTIIAIDHDDYHASHVGRDSVGRQFFLTTPFVPAIGGKSGREFVALFLFDPSGNFLEAKVDDMGPRSQIDEATCRAAFEKRLSELGDVRYERIEVKPFETEQFGTVFGLIPRPPEEDDDDWWVELQPGNYMAFTEPWDSGDYDT
jgi:hypothetical protein